MLVLPWATAGSPYMTLLAIDLLVAALFAVSLHFIMGPGGMHSFGHAAYFGLAAYGAALLDDNGQSVLDQGTGAADYLTWLAALDDAPGTFVDSDYGMLLDRFKKGEFAFLVDGPYQQFFRLWRGGGDQGGAVRRADAEGPRPRSAPATKTT